MSRLWEMPELVSRLITNLQCKHCKDTSSTLYLESPLFWSWHWDEAFWVNVFIVSKCFGSWLFFKNLCSSYVIYPEYMGLIYITWVIQFGMIVGVRTEINISISLNSPSTTWIASTVLNYFMLCFTIEILVALTSLHWFITLFIIE